MNKDRRDYSRINKNQPCVIYANGMEYEVLIINMSMHGIAILAETEINISINDHINILLYDEYTDIIDKVHAISKSINVLVRNINVKNRITRIGCFINDYDYSRYMQGYYETEACKDLKRDKYGKKEIL